MANYEVKNLEGQKVGEIQLDDAVFSAEVKEHLLWEVVKWQRAKARAGTHSTLHQNEVRGGGKKPYRQKGTGRARQGSSRAPQYVGGARVFGPKPRDYEYAVPRQVRQAALRSALSLRVKEAKLIVVDRFYLGTHKTKNAAKVLAKLGATSALVVDGGENTQLQLALRNLPQTKFIAIEGVNVYDVLNYEVLIITLPTVAALQERLRPRRSTAQASTEGGAA